MPAGRAMLYASPPPGAARAGGRRDKNRADGLCFDGRGLFEISAILTLCLNAGGAGAASKNGAAGKAGAGSGAALAAVVRAPGGELIPRPAFVASFGEVQEWLNWQHWKCCVRGTVPWVRIPPSPPVGRCWMLDAGGGLRN